MKEKEIVVLHSTPAWLPQTHTWMYNQVKYSGSQQIINHIVCEQTENLDQFNIKNIHSLYGESEVPTYLNKLRKYRLRKYHKYIESIAEKVRATILHSHFGDVGWQNTAVAQKANLENVTTFYGYDVNLLPVQDSRWLDRYQMLFENTKLILCEGSHMAQCIMDLGCPDEKVKVQHLGIEVHKIPFQPRRWRPGETLRIFIASSFREKKGIPYAIKALGKLREVVPLEVTIIGDAGPAQHFQLEKKKILDEIENQNLKSKVRLLGFQTYSVLLEEAYRNHIYLSPSITASDGDTEGGVPVGIIEMAASGMPVLSTNHCDIPEVIHHGKTGLLSQERDISGLVENLKWLIENPERWKDLQQAARNHIEKEYDARIQGEKLNEIYRQIYNIENQG